MKVSKETEVVAVIVIYFLIYITVIGPAIGSMTGFNTPVLASNSALRRSMIGRVLTTARGWILITGFFPVVFGYMFLRARTAGRTMSEYWNE